jgi:hypothetical protein
MYVKGVISMKNVGLAILCFFIFGISMVYSEQLSFLVATGILGLVGTAYFISRAVMNLLRK